MRILALDYGKKRIGLALSDPLFITAQPHGYLSNDGKLLSHLKDLLQDQEVGEIVIGYPMSMSGNPNEMTKEVDAFIERLKKITPIMIQKVDERLSTASAERLLVEGNVRREKRKESRDTIAASLILQSYLRSKSIL